MSGSSVSKPPLVRGWPIAVLVWLVIQLVAASFLLADVLFGVISGTGYLTAYWTYGPDAFDWTLWPAALVELLYPLLLLALDLWLLRKFFGRSPTFARQFLFILIVSFIAGGVAVVAKSMFVGEEPARSAAVGLVIALGIYQYLVKSPRAAAVFGSAETIAGPAITDA